MKPLLLPLVLVWSSLVAAAEITEEQAMEKVRALPEFIHYAAAHESTFDDNETISERGELPEAIKLPAWRLDVHTLVHDPVADHLSLWNRFIVDADGEIHAWDRVADRIVSLAEWRKDSGQAVAAGEQASWSPDGRIVAAWFDHDGGKPFGVTRSIAVRDSSDPDSTLFSFVGTSRSTQAAWNANSTACVVANEVNWEKALVWLVSKDDKGQWRSRELGVIAPLEAAYRRSIGEKDHPGFRVHVEKIEWHTGSELRFLVWANGHNPELASSGNYQVSFDIGKPGAEPVVEKK
ncbi:hypothetical protein [Haloferula sp. BvORR071]|uniref:hypothetical protein n=1 Tax=Haloferula sp. BvORR071 TaxID=1396141 RepID=UPI002240F8B5|nr:hypothetical protein [Haloferula sp. BvORR071]